MPNRAFSGHGYAVGQRWRFEGKVASPIVLLGRHAVPLTPTLGHIIIGVLGAMLKIFNMTGLTQLATERQGLCPAKG